MIALAWLFILILVTALFATKAHIGLVQYEG